MTEHRTRTRRWSVTSVLAVTALLAAVAALSSGPAAADGNEAPGSPTSFEHLTVGGSEVCVVSDAGALRC